MDRPMARGTDPRTSNRLGSVAPKTVITRTNEMAASMKNPLRGVIPSANAVLPRAFSGDVNACKIAAPTRKKKRIEVFVKSKLLVESTYISCSSNLILIL